MGLSFSVVRLLLNEAQVLALELMPRGDIDHTQTVLSLANNALRGSYASLGSIVTSN